MNRFPVHNSLRAFYLPKIEEELKKRLPQLAQVRAGAHMGAIDCRLEDGTTIQLMLTEKDGLITIEIEGQDPISFPSELDPDRLFL